MQHKTLITDKHPCARRDSNPQSQIHALNRAATGIGVLRYTYIQTYIHTSLLTPRSSPSREANRFSVSQEFSRILWTPKVHYRINKPPATCPYPEPDQSSPCHSSHFLKIQLNIILPSTPRSSKWFPSLKFPHQNPVYNSPVPHTCYMPRPSHSFRFDHPKNIG